LPSSLVLDAGAFYAGTPFLSSDQKLYTTQLVFEEVEHIKSRFSALEGLRESGRLILQDPARGRINDVIAAARSTGDSGELSDADISIIALALELKYPLVTDDLSAANVASTLRLSVKPATAGKDLRQVRKWVYYCSACGKTFSPDQRECALCGNKLKRKYKKVR
jgi:UPF0271 protein